MIANWPSFFAGIVSAFGVSIVCFGLMAWFGLLDQDIEESGRDVWPYDRWGGDGP